MKEPNPEIKDESSATEIKTPNENNKKMLRFLKAVNVLLVILLILFVTGTIAKFILIHNRNHMAQKQEVPTNSKVSMQIQELEEENKQLAAQLAEQQNSIQAMRQNNALSLAEAYQLVRTANTLLLTEGNSKIVEELLSQAINNISGISAYDSIKRQLSRNLMDLQKNSFSATDEIIVKLDTLMETVENLPQIPNQFQDFNKNKPAESQKDEQSNTGLIANIKNVLQKAVIIQPKTLGSPQLLPEQLLVNLKQNIQFKLLNAEWAVMHRQQDLYRSCIKEVKTWMEHYFAESVLQSNNISQTLAELEKVDLNTNATDLAPTIELIKSTLAQKNPTSVKNNTAATN